MEEVTNQQPVAESVKEETPVQPAQSEPIEAMTPVQPSQLEPKVETPATEATASAVPKPESPASQASSSITGVNGPMPDELRGWNWGAFFLNWIWGVANSVWISLLVFVPFINFIMMIILGIYGNQWAWQHRKFESVAQFKEVQYKWMLWGVGIFVVSSVISVIFYSAIIGAIFGAMSSSSSSSSNTPTSAPATDQSY